VINQFGEITVITRALVYSENEFGKIDGKVSNGLVI